MGNDILDLLRCPGTGEPLLWGAIQFVNASLNRRYPVTPSGIPLFAQEPSSENARRQQKHYDRVSNNYLDNMTYPHTREYLAYLDRALLRHAEAASFKNVLDVCCGSGEGLALFRDRIGRGVGVDISRSMLECGRRLLPDERFTFIQGDATALPLKDELFDTVITFGGIHHVNDRGALFAEIHRVLKPGGRLLWREPVNDFWLWRALRRVVYRLSPSLDEETEHPIRYRDTLASLERAGLRLVSWQTFGFLGFCLLMNSDVLVFNRALRFLPGIRTLTRWMAKLDDWTTSLPGLRGAGLQVVGLAEKPIGAGSPAIPARQSA